MENEINHTLECQQNSEISNSDGKMVYCTSKCPSLTGACCLISTPPHPPRDSFASSKSCVIIKLRPQSSFLLDQLFQQQNIDILKKTHYKQNRVKERKIKDVLEKVALWRKLYHGLPDKKNLFFQLPLDYAATII